jgi:hypothetical protein
MKDKKIFLAFFLVAAIMLALLTGCDDAGIETKTATGPMPNIQMKAGSTFIYVTDSISQNGTVNNTAWKTTDVVQAETVYPPSTGRNCFPINSITTDTILNVPIQSQTLYVSYDSQTGLLYQWGVKKIFDPSQTETWDLLADFSKPLETPVSLFTINNVFGQSFLSANVSSKVMYDTAFTTIASAIAVNCYKVAVVADILLSGNSIGKAYLDYYVGYTPSSNPSNPSGMIRVKFFPLNVSGYTATGADQKLSRFTIP